jgi:uncharacterized lipoprotein YehR (DUF1307 family)
VKRIFQILVSPALAILFAIKLSSCSHEDASATATPAAPLSEVDVKINDYEKVANEYGRVAKKLKAGDVSLTVRYLDLGKRTREAAAKLQQESPKMSPPQAHRVGAISARTAPYLQE